MSERTVTALRRAGKSRSGQKNGNKREIGLFVCIPLGTLCALLLGLLLLALCTLAGLKMKD